jgi:hypothetical protein
MIEVPNVIAIQVSVTFKTTKLMSDNVDFTGSREILDDVVRHGCHDVFWCYPFEREVTNFVNIRSNQINSEVTYSKKNSRYWCTKMHRVVQLDRDGLLPDSRALAIIHEYLQTPGNAQHIQLLGSRTICEHWYKSCVIVVPSQDVARSI